MRSRFLIVVVCLLSIVATVKGKGVIKGSVKDESSKELLFGVNVFVVNSSMGASTDFDGNFSFEVPAGTYSIKMTLVGYSDKVLSGVVVKDNQIVELNELLKEDSKVLGEVKVVATARKESQRALMVEQKKSTVIKESVGAEQLSNQGVSNAAGATTKLAGVTKLEGSSRVYVRGLGDRYTTTRLNGLPLPSNDPKLKNISLSLFSTDIIQNIGVSKTFSAGLSGDVAGADIDIKTKEISGSSMLNVGFSLGGNSQTTGKDFKRIDGSSYWGFADNLKHPVTSLDKYAFTDKLSLTEEKGNPSFSLSINGGRRFDVGDSGNISAFVVASFKNGYNYNDGFSINHYTKDRKGSSYSSAKEFKYATTKLAMGNIVYRINANHKISYTSLFVHSNSQSIKDYYGTKPDVAEGGGVFANLILQKENQNQLFVNQLISKHNLGETVDLNLSLAYNTIANDEPNRKRNIFIVDEGKNEIKYANGTPRNNSRYYHNLNENDFIAKLAFVKHFGSRIPEDSKGKVEIGYEFRNTDRHFDAFYFDHDLFSSSAIKNGDINNVFTQRNLDDGIFRVITGYGFGSNALDPFWNSGEKTSNVAYAVIDYKLTDKLFVSAGARFENIKMNVEWKTNLNSSEEEGAQQLNKSYLLPSLNFKYSLNDKNQLRFATSKTYTYPQFKEIAPFVYEGISYTEAGNRSLKPSENYNIDLKWEYFFPKSGLISVAVFGKYIEDAINRIEKVAASDNQFTFFNTGNAKVYGIELEMKKDLYSFADEDAEYISKLTGGFNASYMKAEQDFDVIPGFDPTTQTESLEGASPLVLNADLSYRFSEKGKKTTASIILNYQHEKLYAVGTEGTASIVQKPTAMLDFVFKHSFNRHFGVKLSLKNILDSKFEKYRNVEDVLITRSYRRGLDFSVGLTYKL